MAKYEVVEYAENTWNEDGSPEMLLVLDPATPLEIVRESVAALSAAQN